MCIYHIIGHMREYMFPVCVYNHVVGYMRVATVCICKYTKEEWYLASTTWPARIFWLYWKLKRPKQSPGLQLTTSFDLHIVATFSFVVRYKLIVLPCWVRTICTCRVVAGDLAQCLTVDIICAFAGGPGSVLIWT